MSTIAAAFIVGWVAGSVVVALGFRLNEWHKRHAWDQAGRDTLAEMERLYGDDPGYQAWKMDRKLEQIEADLRADGTLPKERNPRRTHGDPV